MKFTIPWVPPSLNVYSRAHWTRRRHWVETAALHIAKTVGRGEADGLHRLRVTIQQYRRREVDFDNLVGGCKPLIDALVRMGWARDDNRYWMEQVIRPVVVDHRRAPETEISIEPLESGTIEANA